MIVQKSNSGNSLYFHFSKGLIKTFSFIEENKYVCFKESGTNITLVFKFDRCKCATKITKKTNGQYRLTIPKEFVDIYGISKGDDINLQYYKNNHMELIV